MKKVFNILVIALFVTGLIVGSTYSYFTAGTNASDVAFTLGQLDIEITEQPDSNSLTNWEQGPDNAKTLSWTFKNTGSKTAYLRAKLDSFWEIPDQGHDCGGTAWAGKTEGTTPSAIGYHNQGNPFRYFEFDSEETSTTRDLAMGNGQETVGSLAVELIENVSGSVLRFEVNIDQEFDAKDLHLHISNSKSTYDVSPPPLAPGNFKYKNNDFTGAGSFYSIEINSGDVSEDFNEKMYIAFHISLECESESDSGETTFESGEQNASWEVIDSSKWEKGSDGYWYYSDIVELGEEVVLEFTIEMISLDGYKNAKYFIDLTLDAVQTTNNSLDSNWPNWPYN